MIAIRDQWTMLRDAVAIDRARPLRRVDDVDFLPAAMEVVERPVSPTWRATAWALMGALAFAMLWLTFGRVDIVASAPGTLLPVDDIKIVQPAEPGVVRAILVRDGQHVAKGQPLVALDPTTSAADETQAREQLAAAELQAARGRAVLSALDGHGFAFVPPPGTPPDTAALAGKLARATLDNLDAEVATRAADRSAAVAAREEALTQAAKLTETLPLLDQQLAANEALLDKGYVSKLRVIEMRRQRLSTARDRDAARQTAGRATANIASAGGSLAGARATARAQVIADIVKADADARQYREQLVKAASASGHRQLVAPVAGTVSQLALHTVGGTVEAFKPVMQIVPDGAPLIAEARLANRDAAFVRRGDPVTIKVDAYPFTDYGTVPATVLGIGSFTVDDEKRGPVYIVRARIDPAHDARTRALRLLPGMTVTADIRTGRRSILAYLVSPVRGAMTDAARER